MGSRGVREFASDRHDAKHHTEVFADLDHTYINFEGYQSIYR
jgi:hypothetical protein